MANHKSAEKRARQREKRTERNRSERAKIRSLSRAALDAPQSEKGAALGKAFSAIQKGKSVLHPNTMRRKMARLSKAIARSS